MNTRGREKRSIMDYLQRIKQLAPPTAQQIADFAAYVAEAHSWYKHLPLTRAKPFYGKIPQP